MAAAAAFVGPAEQGDTEVRRSRSRLGMVVTGALGGALVCLYAVAAPFVAPAFRRVCLPFVPATSAQVHNVLRVLRGRTGTLVDIGSGDGRIVISAALQGFQASGLELNPWLVWFSRCRALRAGVHHHTSFHISDLWKVNLSQYSNVVVFGVPQMMDELEQKLADELEITAKVVACRFPFPSWAPERTAGEGIDTVWLYDAKTFKSHRSRGATGTGT